jgi:hypothetical protein
LSRALTLLVFLCTGGRLRPAYIDTHSARGARAAKEAVMRTIAVAAIALATLSLAGTAARADGPWCAYDTRGGTNCGFYSYPQCLAYITGIGGYCAENPQYVGPGNRRRRR